MLRRIKIASIALVVIVMLVIIGYSWFTGEPADAYYARQARMVLARTPIGVEFTQVDKRCNPARTVCKKAITNYVVNILIRDRAEFVLVRADGNSCASMTPGYVVKCGTRNGLNTPFIVTNTKRDAFTVYAIGRYLEVSKIAIKNAVYTPYSSEFNTFRMRRYGKHYLDHVVDRAYSKLVTRKIRSLSNRRAYVHTQVPRDMPKHLAVIEHISPERFLHEPIQELVDEVYVTLALNQGGTYRYAKSSAGALALMQFMPKTYRALPAAYPRAGLKRDFVRGTVDHVNAMMAAVLLIDHDMSQLPPTQRKQVFADRTLYFMYATSSYNGGSPRAKKLLSQNKHIVKDNENIENRTYVQKALAAADLSSFI
jgi:hypothetical protein